MTTLHSALLMIAGFVGAVAGLCYFIDRIATTEFRAHVARLLVRHSAGVERTTVAQHVQRYIAGTVGHFFGGEFFSWRNIGRSFLLTFLALLVIIPVTCLINQKSPANIFTIWGELESRRNLMVLAFLLVSCFVIDMLSFLQTAMFMRLTAYVPRLRDMVAMSFFDVVVTLNLFSMLFAAFLVPLVSYIDARGTMMDVRIEDDGPASNLKSARGKGSPMEALRGAGLVISNLGYRAKRPDDDKWKAVASGYVAVKGYTIDDAVKAFLSSTGAKREAIRETTEKSEFGMRERAGVSASIAASGLHRRLSTMQLYQAIYMRSHVVQDAFMALMKLQLLTIDTSALFSIVEEHASTPLKYGLPYFSLCDGQARYEVTIEVRSCEKYAVLDVGTPFTRLYTWLMVFHPEIEPLPITMIAASSLFLTMAFYMGLAIYSAIAFAARYASGVMLSDKYLDLKVAPLTVGSIYAMLCLAPVGILIAVLLS